MTELTYVVVRNAEEQYSIWPSYREVPAGWDVITEAMAKSDCLSYVEQHWADIRPKSLRDKLAAMETKQLAVSHEN